MDILALGASYCLVFHLVQALSHADSIENSPDPFEYVYLSEPKTRQRRNIYHGLPVELNYTITMFGSDYRLLLRQAIVASSEIHADLIGQKDALVPVKLTSSQTNCHYQGTARTCQASGTCFEGRAAVSRFVHGVRGILKIGGEDILIEPLPETLLARRMRFSNVHIARKRILSDVEAEQAENLQLLDHLAKSLQYPPTSNHATQAPDILLVNVGVFVDKPMSRKLTAIFPSVEDRITVILAAYNAVNLLYQDTTVGKTRVKLLVKRIHLDESGAMPRDEKVTEYLADLCKRYQKDVLAKFKMKKDWDLTTALTGLDVYADAADVTRDAAYRNLRGSAKKIFTVSGVSYGGGMCSTEKNCMVAEFSLLFGNIETIAHETGHTLGMYHDGSGNKCDRKGNKIMSIQRPQRQRSGWSACSTESLHQFVVSGHASCLVNKHGPYLGIRKDLVLNYPMKLSRSRRESQCGTR